MRSWIRTCLLALCCLATVHDGFAAPPRSIQSFMQLEPEWPSFATTETVFTLEGRYSSISKTALRFQNCDLPFRARAAQGFPPIVGDSRTVEVTGKLERRAGKVEFVIDELRQLPADADRLRTRLSEIREPTPEAYYELGRWADARAAFYDDEYLRERAVETFYRGVLLERSRIKAGDAEALLALAARLPECKQPERLRQEYAHEAFRMLWASSQKQGQPPAAELAKRLSQELDGASQRLSSPELELTENYLANPLAAYAEHADPETRQKLHRIFRNEILLSGIEEQAAADGSNGYKIATEIALTAPERQDLIDQWQERELAYRLSRIADARRHEAIELSDMFLRRNAPERAADALKRWLAAREHSQWAEGTSGLIRLADDYLELVRDREQSARFLLEAYALTPESEEISEKLKKLGYEQRDGRWLSRNELKALSVDALEAAVREGRILVGMTDRQVRKAIGAPTEITRIASRGKIHEIWVYGERGTSRLAVHFLRRARQDDATSVAISQSQALAP
jgi:hypothetical protein